MGCAAVNLEHRLEDAYGNYTCLQPQNKNQTRLSLVKDTLEGTKKFLDKHGYKQFVIKEVRKKELNTS